MQRAVFLLTVAVATACGSKRANERVVTTSGASLRVPDGVDLAKVKLSVAAQLPEDLSRFTLAIENHFKLAQVVRLEPAGMAMPSPAELATSAAGCAVTAQIAVALDVMAKPEVLPVRVEDGQLRISVPKLTAVAVLCPAGALIGSTQQVLRGTPELLVGADCASFITPDAPGVRAAVADPKRFEVDADGNVTVQPKLVLRPFDDLSEQARADEVLTRGGGDEVSLGVVYASLFAAKGYAVALAGGAIAYDGKKGVSLWTVVAIDGKPMFVDVRKAKLLPLADATTQYGLEMHRGCTRYAPNGSTDPAQFIVQAPTPPAPPADQVKPADDTSQLLDRRKQLDKQCNHGADKVACMERGKLDDQLKKQLDGLLAQHKDLESKCKANLDADACAKRDRVAEQGKAIKAQLDAKP